MPTVQANNIEIAYEIEGSGPPVLLISGFSSGGNVWRLVASELSQSCQVITFDNRGVGRSSAPRTPYTISQLADDAAALLDALGVKIEETVVAGHSMGGFIALTLGTRDPRPAGLVLISTGGMAADLSDDAEEALFRTAGSREGIIDGVIDVGVGARAKTERPENIKAFKEMLLSCPPRGTGYMGQAAALAVFDIREKLGDIACPCHIVHGTNDRMMPLAQAEVTAKALPNATMTVLPEIGHFPFIEAPEKLVSPIVEMVNAVDEKTPISR